MRDGMEVICGVGTREQDGSCNGCQTREEDTVYIVSLPSICVRVCRKCANDLVKKLTFTLLMESK